MFDAAKAPDLPIVLLSDKIGTFGIDVARLSVSRGPADPMRAARLSSWSCSTTLLSGKPALRDDEPSAAACCLVEEFFRHALTMLLFDTPAAGTIQLEILGDLSILGDKLPARFNCVPKESCR